MKMRMSRMVRAATILMVLSIGGGAALADNYPNKPIHMVIPWAAGGGTDAIGRGIAEPMKEASGVPIVIDNISGAAGATGSIKVTQSKPDGYTVLMNGDTDLVSSIVFTDVKVPLTLDDFVFIGGFFESPTWILAHKDSGIDNMEGFLKKAKDNPGKLTLGSGGSTQMVMAAAIKGYTGLDFRIIPYQGGNDLKKALLGNQVDAGIIHAPVLLPEVEAGLIKVIGTGKPLSNITYKPVRSVKTLKEIGIPVSIGITRGVYMPKNTPADIQAKMAEIVQTAAKSESFKKFGQQFGFEPVWIPGSEFERENREAFQLFNEIKTKYIK